jgi:hypothetical protein
MKINSYDAVLRLGIVDAIPEDGSTSYEDLSAVTGVTPFVLKKIVRYSVTHHLLREDASGRVGHTGLSRLLKENKAIRDSYNSMYHDIYPGVRRQVDALLRWPEADEPFRTGHAVSEGREVPFFETIQSDPEKARRFATLMSQWPQKPEMSLQHLVRGFDWASLDDGQVIDLGGSRGEVASVLVEAFPRLQVRAQFRSMKTY